MPVNSAITTDDEMSKQKVARTIADLGGREDIYPQHIGEAMQYRSLSF